MHLLNTVTSQNIQRIGFQSKIFVDIPKELLY
jgi:hypothetical protein